MFKKIGLILAIVVFSVSIAVAKESKSNLYPVEPPTTERQIEQIKWAHNQGYIFGIIASYGWFKPVKHQNNFVLPIIKTAWEAGYIKGVLEVAEWEKANSKKSTK